MNYDIIKNYSPLNCYEYQGKSSIISAIDWCSTPCRRLLGGRNVYLEEQTYSHKMSNAMKITVLFFSVVIFPIAIIAVTSLALKLITFPWKWEKNIVKEVSERALKDLENFNTAFTENKYDEAIEVVKQRPDLMGRNQVNHQFFQIINRKINQNAPWTEVEGLLRFLSFGDAKKLIAYAIKLRLVEEFRENTFLTTPDEIFKFINESQGRYSLENLEELCKLILVEAFKVTPGQPPAEKIMKMDFADRLLRNLTEIKLRHVENQFPLPRDEIEQLRYKNGISSVEIDEETTRMTFIDEPMELMELRIIFREREDMKQIRAAAEALRHVSQIGSQAIKKIDAGQEEQAMSIYEQFKEDLIKTMTPFGLERLDRLKDSAQAFVDIMDKCKEIKKGRTEEELLDGLEDVIKRMTEAVDKKDHQQVNAQERVEPFLDFIHEKIITIHHQVYHAVYEKTSEPIEEIA